MTKTTNYQLNQVGQNRPRQMKDFNARQRDARRRAQGQRRRHRRGTTPPLARGPSVLVALPVQLEAGTATPRGGRPLESHTTAHLPPSSPRRPTMGIHTLFHHPRVQLCHYPPTHPPHFNFAVACSCGGYGFFLYWEPAGWQSPGLSGKRGPHTGQRRHASEHTGLLVRQHIVSSFGKFHRADLWPEKVKKGPLPKGERSYLSSKSLDIILAISRRSRC